MTRAATAEPPYGFARRTHRLFQGDRRALTALAETHDPRAPGIARVAPWAQDDLASAPPCRALFVLPDLRGGGAERVVLTLLGAFDRERISPELFLVKREGLYFGEVPPRVAVTAGIEGGRLLPNLPRVVARLVAAARRADVVVGALELDATYLAWLAARIAGRPLIAWAHVDMEMHLLRMPARHRTLSRALYPRLRHVVVPAGGLRDPLARATGAVAEHVRLIGNALDVAAVRARGSMRLPAELEPAFAAPVVLGVGHLSTQKGFDVLVRAHALRREHGACEHLVVLGEGPERDALLALARSLGVQDSVFFPGFVANPYPAMRRARVLALSSRQEGFGMVLVEAMALDTPVVTTDSAGPVDVVQGGVSGVVVPIDDVTALAAALASVSDDAATRERLVAAGRRRVVDFAAERIASEWETLLADVRTGR